MPWLCEVTKRPVVRYLGTYSVGETIEPVVPPMPSVKSECSICRQRHGREIGHGAE